MRKLVILVFVALAVVSCAEVKRPGLEMSVFLDTRAVKTAVDPKSNYMKYFQDLVEQNKDTYISCDANGSCIYMANAGKEAENLLQKGIWENISEKNVIVEIRRKGAQEIIKSISIPPKKFVRFALMPGEYESIAKFKGEMTETKKTWKIDMQRGDSFSVAADEWVDFTRTSTPTP